MQNNETKKPHIVVPGWMKEETPIVASFCELVNFALEDNPDMTLAEFAEKLNDANMSAALERLEAVEKRQFQGKEGQA